MENRFVDDVRGWQHAPALVLSCPGPLRRLSAALIAMNKLALPQVFLGGESQCLAFAAAHPGLAGRMFFAPAPEMFSDPLSLHAAWRAVGETPHSAGEVVHLRFGSVRDSRILKAARNAAVIAETETAAPITASHHPFASGRVLPAAMQHVFVYGRQTLRPSRIGGPPLPTADLPANCITADLEQTAMQKPARGRAPAGLELVRLAEFEARAWASGQIGRPGAMPGKAAVLLPWNMAHIGSIVPELLRRLAAFRLPGGFFPAVLLMPFNDRGDGGMIRDLKKTIGNAAEGPDGILKTIFVARVTHLRGLARLKTLSRTVWVDGSDPESWWSLARLGAAGFETVRIQGDEPVRIEEDTRFGRLYAEVQMPALRSLRRLLEPLGSEPTA